MAFITFHKNPRARDLFNSLFSVRFTAILLFILILVAILGSFIPQERTFSEYARVYGIRLTEIFYRLHLNTLFTSAGFLLLIFFLSVNILGCFVKSLLAKKRSVGFLTIHLSLILLLAGGMLSAVGRVHGEVDVLEGQTVAAFTSGNRTIPLGFELRLKDFELQKYEGGRQKILILVPGRKEPLEFAFRKKVWTAVPGTDLEFQVEEYVPDFRYDVTRKMAFSVSNEPNNPAILVHVRGKDVNYAEWVFHRYADFHGESDKLWSFRYIWAQEIPKAFISHVEVLENGKKVMERAIEVNKPLSYKGFSIYQATYDSQEGKWSGFDIEKDPGTGVVYASILLIMFGLVQSIYLKPFLKKKKKPDTK